MARSKTLTVSALKLHNVIRQLRKFENVSPDLLIDNQPISDVLLEISNFENADASIEVEVKIAILETDGDNDPNPSTLPNDKDISDFNFSDIQYINLTDQFNKIARKRNSRAKISIPKAKGCEKVKDCVDLVSVVSKA